MSRQEYQFRRIERVYYVRVRVSSASGNDDELLPQFLPLLPHRDRRTDRGADVPRPSRNYPFRSRSVMSQVILFLMRTRQRQFGRKTLEFSLVTFR